MSATMKNVWAVHFDGARNADYYVADGLIDLANQLCNACEDSYDCIRLAGNILRIERLGQLARGVSFKELARA